MKVKRMSDNLSDLEIKQLKVIDELQEEIKLKNFDISKARQQIYLLNRKIENTKEAIKNIIKEIQKIEISKDFTRLHFVVLMLNSTSKDGVLENEE